MHSLNKSLAFNSRRAILQVAAAAALFIAGLAGGLSELRAEGASVPIDQLMAEGALPDIPMGKSDAPVTIVEYASMTCSHCAAFHANSYPALKSNILIPAKCGSSCANFR